jgi:hypothetical protein
VSGIITGIVSNAASAEALNLNGAAFTVDASGITWNSHFVAWDY